MHAESAKSVQCRCKKTRLRQLRAAESCCSELLEESALFATGILGPNNPRLAAELLSGDALTMAVGLLRRARRAGAPLSGRAEPRRAVVAVLKRFHRWTEARVGQPTRLAFQGYYGPMKCLQPRHCKKLWCALR